MMPDIADYLCISYNYSYAKQTSDIKLLMQLYKYLLMNKFRALIRI